MDGSAFPTPTAAGSSVRSTTGPQGFGPDNQVQPSSVLVDGVVAATWRITRAGGTATLSVRPFRRLAPTEYDAVTAEGTALLTLLHPHAIPDVTLSHPS